MENTNLHLLEIGKVMSFKYTKKMWQHEEYKDWLRKVSCATVNNDI